MTCTDYLLSCGVMDIGKGDITTKLVFIDECLLFTRHCNKYF